MDSSSSRANSLPLIVICALLFSALSVSARLIRKNDDLRATFSSQRSPSRTLTQTQIEPTASVYEEQLEDACYIESVSNFFQDSVGVVCQLAASVLGHQEIQRYFFTVTEEAASVLSLQIALTQLRGETVISIERKDAEQQWQSVSLDEYGSAESIFFIPSSTLAAGDYAIAVEAKSTTSLFSVRAELMRGDAQLDVISRVLLDEIKNACCSLADPCTGVLAHLGTDSEQQICSTEAGVHCSSDGSLTHLDLSESNMQCSFSDLSPLIELPPLQMLQLSKNNISGDITDSTLLSSLPSLRYLQLDDLPDLTGSIPAACSSPFSHLFHLGISNTGISGEVPVCLLKAVHQLEMSNTKISGAFPDIPADSNLRVLIADATDGAGSALTDTVPKLSGAVHLHYVSFANHSFTGTLDLPASVKVALFNSNQLTGLTVPSLDKLEALDVSSNMIAGAIPEEIALAPQLVLLDMSHNAFTHLPDIWAISRLHEFRASNNQLEGILPPSLGESNHLRVLDLSSNSLSNTIEEFATRLSSESSIMELNVADNAFTGSLFTLHMLRLGLFTSAHLLESDPTISTQTHVLDLSNNQLAGEVDMALLQAIEVQVRYQIPLSVDLQGNSITCPSEEEFVRLSLREEWRQNLGCLGTDSSTATTSPPSSTDSSGSGKSTAMAVVFSLALIALVIGGCFALYRWRQRSPAPSGDRRGAAHKYVLQAVSNMGIGSGGKQRLEATRSNSTKTEGTWGFMSGAKFDAQGASAAPRGRKMYEDLSVPMTNDDASSTPRMGNSGLRVNTNKQRDMRALTSVELSSPMSDISSRLGTPAKVVSGKKSSDEGGSDGDAERNMRVQFNAAFAPP